MQVIVKLTNQCNLRCRYCSEGNPEEAQYLDMEIGKKMLNELPALLDLKKDKKINILWHGGEPLLYPRQNLCQLMDHAKEVLAGYELKFSMQTNGYGIDDDWLDVFRRYDISVGLSMDGYRELHDAGRQTPEGQGSYDRVFANLQRMQAAGMKAGVLMVLDTTAPIDVDKLMEQIIKCGGDIKIHPVMPCGRAADREDIEKINQCYIALLQELFVRCVQSEAAINISPLRELLEAIIADSNVGECSYSGTCGENFICVYSDGSVGVCGRRLADKTFEYGRLQESSLLDLYQSALAQQVRGRADYLAEHDCKDCAYWQWCHGGCTFEAMNMTGDVFTKYPLCRYRKQLIDYLIEEGLPLLKEKLIRQRSLYRQIIKRKKEILKDIENA